MSVISAVGFPGLVSASERLAVEFVPWQAPPPPRGGCVSVVPSGPVPSDVVQVTREQEEGESECVCVLGGGP